MNGSVVMNLNFWCGSDLPLSITYSMWRLFLREMSITVEQKKSHGNYLQQAHIINRL
jgi:hypothetical protein